MFCNISRRYTWQCIIHQWWTAAHSCAYICSRSCCTGLDPSASLAVKFTYLSIPDRFRQWIAVTFVFVYWWFSIVVMMMMMMMISLLVCIMCVLHVFYFFLFLWQLWVSCIDLSVQFLAHAVINKCHVFYFVQINMDGWMDDSDGDGGGVESCPVLAPTRVWDKDRGHSHLNFWQYRYFCQQGSFAYH